MSKQNELKELEKLATRIARKKAKLEAQVKAEKETSKWYDQVLKESGFKRPKDFIKALMEHFGMRTVSLAKAKRQPGRPAKTAAKPKGKAKAGSTGRRKRTKITADLRDKVKASLGKGVSRNATAKSIGISYPIVKKIEDGTYDAI